MKGHAVPVISLDYNAAHEFVARTPRAHWDGWEIVTFTPTFPLKAQKDPKGAFRRSPTPEQRGTWGIEQRFGCDENGMWNVRVPRHKANA